MQYSDLNVKQLQQLSYAEICKLFRTLSAPKLEQMQGEYRALMLAQPNWLSQKLGDLLHTDYVNWQSKAFRPVSSTEGRGYNFFMGKRGAEQLYPMKTLIAPSRYDQKPAYTLVYAAFDSLCGRINMVDEIRQINDTLYLGMGTWGFSAKQRRVGYPFLLQDVGAAYRGDIGVAKADFIVSKKHIPALK